MIDELLGTATERQKARLLVQCRLGFYPNSIYSLIKEDNEPAAIVMLTSGGTAAGTDIPLKAATAADAWLAEVRGSGALGFWCAEVAVFRDVNAAAPERFLALRRVRGPAVAKKGSIGKPKKRVDAVKTRARPRKFP